MRQWTVDAFAAQPFRGNPACVVEPMDAWPDALDKRPDDVKVVVDLRQ